MTSARNPPEPVHCFVTLWWRLRGVVEVTGFIKDGRFSNWSCYRELGDRSCSGRVGYSAFPTREEAVAAVRQKAAAAAKRMRRELARIEAIADGSVTP